MSQSSSPEIELLKQSLSHCFADGLAHNEGFYVTESEARARKIYWPTLSQKNNNPVNLRSWGSYPVKSNYACFPGPDGSSNPQGHLNPAGCILGWKAAYKQVYRNVFDRGLNFYEFFEGKEESNEHVVYAGFANRKDGNDPVSYSQFVLDYLKRHWQPLLLAKLSETAMDAITTTTVIRDLIAMVGHTGITVRETLPLIRSSK